MQQMKNYFQNCLIFYTFSGMAKFANSMQDFHKEINRKRKIAQYKQLQCNLYIDSLRD